MTENKQYKVISDNFGEYSVLRHDNSIVITEIPRKAMAELFCDELNDLNNENEELTKFLLERDVKNETIKIIYKNLKLKKEIMKLKKENWQLKQQLGDIDSLIYDLGYAEMQRQYEEITDD